MYETMPPHVLVSTLVTMLLNDPKLLKEYNALVLKHDGMSTPAQTAWVYHNLDKLRLKDLKGPDGKVWKYLRREQ